MLGIISYVGNGQIKIAMKLRYHFTHTKIVVIKKVDNKMYWQGGSEIRTVIHFSLLVKWWSYFGKSLAAPQRLDIELLYDQAIPFPLSRGELKRMCTQKRVHECL